MRSGLKHADMRYVENLPMTQRVLGAAYDSHFLLLLLLLLLVVLLLL